MADLVSGIAKLAVVGVGVAIIASSIRTCGNETAGAPPSRRAIAMRTQHAENREGTPRHTSASIAIDGSVPANAADEVRKAIGIFHSACSDIDEHADDVEWARASFERIKPGGDYRRDRYGWRTKVIVEVQLSDNPTTFGERAPQFNGQHLTYHLGGGQSPGITASKRPEQWLCGMVAAGGSDVFRPEVELNFLK